MNNYISMEKYILVTLMMLCARHIDENGSSTQYLGVVPVLDANY